MDKECHLPFQWTNGAAPVKPSATAAAPHLLTHTKMINLKCLLLWLAVHLLVLSLHSFFFPSKTPFYPDSSLTKSLRAIWKTVIPVLSHSILLTLCEPRDCSPPGSFVHGILQARILEWVAILFSRASSQCRDLTWVSRIAGRLFTVWATREAL